MVNAFIMYAGLFDGSPISELRASTTISENWWHGQESHLNEAS
jgi:hypothetical protein